jgi:predicted chitinase
MQEFGINTPKRAAAFLAQVAHEIGEFKYMEELASGAAYEGRRDLGNTQPGDGVRYKGRGPIQLTGRANYAEASRALGIDLVNHPEMASRPDIGFKLAGWFWQKKGLNQLADQGNFNEITRRVNGGFNGKASRDHYLALASRALGAGMAGGPLSTGDTPIPPMESGPRSYGITKGGTYASSNAEAQRMVHSYALNGKVDENLLFLMILRAMSRVRDEDLARDPGFAAFAAAAGWQPGQPIPEDLKAEFLTQLLTQSAHTSQAPHRLDDAYAQLERRFPSQPADAPR